MRTTPSSSGTGRRGTLAAVTASAVLTPLVLAGCQPASGSPADGDSVKQQAQAGGRSAGERLFPHLGNTGYDARSYRVHYDYRTGTKTMDSSVDMDARATRALSSFSLDSVGQRIHSVTVNGSRAKFHTDAKQEKLVVHPDSTLVKGRTFRTRIHYTADRSKNPATPSAKLPPGTKWPLKHWANTKDGFALMGQPDRAHLFFPSNDVPRDKARFTLSVSTPRNVRAVANGSQIGHRQLPGNRQEFTYRTRDAIPTDIVQVAVGRFREVRQRGPHGTPVVSYLPTDASRTARKMVDRAPGHMAWLERTLGLRFPFEKYGSLGVHGTYSGMALETAGLSTYSSAGLAQGQKVEPMMVHELVHQYFGDAVSVRSWDDMWLSEGHATYYENRYQAEHGDESFEKLMHKAYKTAVTQRANGGPPGRVSSPLGLLFETNDAGQLMLYGLHQKVGDATFQKIEQTFFRTYQGRSASTADYVKVANRVSGRNLTPYFRQWMYGKTTPTVPGHPEWKTSK